MRSKNKEQEKDTELDYHESSKEAEVDKVKKDQLLEAEKKRWKVGGWNANPKVCDTLRAKLIGEMGDLFEDFSVIDYFLMQLPIQYIKHEMLPATNAAVS